MMLVLGIGNPLLGDDGFGVEVARRLKEAGEVAGVEIVDGGSQGLYLLPYLQGRSHIIVADAIAFGGEPGEIVRLNADQIPARLQVKVSEHQISFHEVLALMQLLGEEPEEFVFFGVEPKSNEWGDGLSPEIAAAVDPVIEKIKEQIAIWKGGANGTDERHPGIERDQTCFENLARTWRESHDQHHELPADKRRFEFPGRGSGSRSHHDQLRRA
jgi:hydrogenase maturation protease